MKRCNGCGQVKPLEDFSPDSRQRDGRRGQCKACVAGGQRERYRTTSEQIRESRQAELTSLRAQVFGHYGQACACCGTTGNLTIDHVTGDGKAHRLALFGDQTAGGLRLYRWLVAQGFPPGFQTLCRPCNRSKGDGSVCRLHHDGEDAKRCPGCDQIKPLTAFGIRTSRPGGRQSRCRDCRRRKEAA